MEVAVSPSLLVYDSSEPDPDLVLVLGRLPVTLGLSGRLSGRSVGLCRDELGRWCSSSPPEMLLVVFVELTCRDLSNEVVVVVSNGLFQKLGGFIVGR